MLFSVYVSYVLLKNAVFYVSYLVLTQLVCHILKVNVAPGPKGLPTPGLGLGIGVWRPSALHPPPQSCCVTVQVLTGLLAAEDLDPEYSATPKFCCVIHRFLLITCRQPFAHCSFQACRPRGFPRSAELCQQSSGMKVSLTTGPGARRLLYIGLPGLRKECCS